MASDRMIEVQVCYVTAEKQFLHKLFVEEGTTIREALASSGLMSLLGGVDLTELKVGIYSRLKTLDTELRERDRVEVYRPLEVDPKSARRKRVKRKG